MMQMGMVFVAYTSSSIAMILVYAARGCLDVISVFMCCSCVVSICYLHWLFDIVCGARLRVTLCGHAKCPLKRKEKLKLDGT